MIDVGGMNKKYFLRNNDLGFGARMVFGLTYAISRSPVDAFLELIPVLQGRSGDGFRN